MSAESSSVPASRREARRARNRGGVLSLLRDIAIIVIIALLVSFLVKTFVVRSFFIPSGSMNMTLVKDDRILVDELTPRFTGYDRGDIVVFRDPGGWLSDMHVDTPSKGPFLDGVDWVLSLVGLAAPDSADHLIKRVIGLPGDHVVCCNAIGQIEVNGTPIDESAYLNLAPGATAPERLEYDITVPKDSLWVLGDNRDRSADSRFNQDKPGHGFVPLDDLVGRAFLRTWPFDRFGGLGSDGDAFEAVPAPEPSPSP